MDKSLFFMPKYGPKTLLKTHTSARHRSRRQFMLGGVAVLGMPWLAACAPNNRQGPQTLMSSICDTILPADEHPGALDLGIDQQLIDVVNSGRTRFDFISSTITFIDNRAKQQHHRSFTELDIDERERLVLELLQNAPSAQRRQQMNLRAEVLRRYYRTETGHHSLGYRAPNSYLTGTRT